jgi:hypothetical protein
MSDLRRRRSVGHEGQLQVLDNSIDDGRVVEVLKKLLFRAHGGYNMALFIVLPFRTRPYYMPPAGLLNPADGTFDSAVPGRRD